MGFGRITVWDFDTVELHNVDNQLYGEDMVGFSKVAALEEIISRLAGVNITPWDFMYNLAEPISADEIIILATDSIGSRKEIWDAIKFKPFKA